MPDDVSVDCETHGERMGALVCQHLASGGVGRGFHNVYPEDDPDAIFADAWCDECEAAWQKEGEWNDQVSSLVGLRVICSICYLKCRLLNWPARTRHDEEELIAKSVEYLRACQDNMSEEFRINQHERFDWTQASGQLVFSNQGTPAVIAQFQFVGSVSTNTNSWLWSWANPSDEEPVRAQIRRVREYGDEHRLMRLACAYWSAEEVDGWEMTAVAAYLLKAKGAYRTPDGHRFVFMVLTDVRWAQ